jgi:hypothetical protein
MFSSPGRSGRGRAAARHEHAAGEMLAKAQDALQQRVASLAACPEVQERMQDMMSGGFGKGRSALQAAKNIPEGLAILPELERLAAERKQT